VDADKQLEWVDYMKPIHGIGLEPVVAVETVRDLIKGAATIDAIPVEWLRKKREVAIWQFAGAIDWLLSDWQKEQEAQEGRGVRVGGVQ
jgi:hypothetical protein